MLLCVRLHVFFVLNVFLLEYCVVSAVFVVCVCSFVSFSFVMFCFVDGIALLHCMCLFIVCVVCVVSLLRVCVSC